MKIFSKLLYGIITFSLIMSFFLLTFDAISKEKPDANDKNISERDEEDVEITPPATYEEPDDENKGDMLDLFTNIFSPGDILSSEEKRSRSAMRHYLAGQMLFEQNKYNEALKEFEKAYREDDDSLKILLQRAWCHYYLNEAKKSFKLLDRILEEDPEYIPAMMLRARTYEAIKNYTLAKQIYNSILDIEPKNTMALERLGTIYYQYEGNMKKAIEIYEKVLEIDRRDIMAHVIIGSSHAILGNVDESLEYYQRAVSHRPRLVEAYINLAKLFMENRNFDAVERVYELALTADPYNAEVQKAFHSFLQMQAIRRYSKIKASESVMKGDERPALSVKEIIKDPKLHDILEKEMIEGYRTLAENSGTTQPALIQIYAETLMQYEHYEEARQEYKGLLEIEPNNFKAYVALGNIAILQNRPEDAIKAFDKAIAINPDNTEVYSQIGAAYLERKEYQKALELYKRAVKIRPDEEKLHIILYQIYDQLGMDDQAEQILLNVAKRHPEQVNLQGMLGDYYRERRRYEEALEYYQKAYELNKQSRGYASMMISTLLELDKPEKAFEFAKKAKKNVKRINEYLIATGLYFSDYGYFDKALHFLEEARERDPTNLSIYAFIASVYNYQKEYEKALEQFDELLRDMPDYKDHSGFYEMLGSVLSEQKKTEEAIEKFEKAVSLNPESKDAYLSWATLLNSEKEYKKAMDVLDQAMKHIEPDSEKGMHLKAQILSGQNKFEEAEKLFNLLLQKNPGNVMYLYNLGNMYYEADRFDEAESLLQQVIEKQPQLADAYNNLAYMYAERGVKLDKALNLVEKALYLRPGAAYMIDTLGWVYYQMGEYEKALKHLKRAEKLSLEDAVLYDHLADTYQKLDQMNKAREYWKKAYEIDPDLEGLKEKLEK